MHHAADRARQKAQKLDLPCGLGAISGCYGYSRQAWYKRRDFEKEQESENTLIKEAVLKVRYRQPRVGGRKLMIHINAALGSQKITVGRDRLFDLLRGWDLLIRPKRNYKRTTNSQHRFKVHKNLIKDKGAKRPNEIFVSDITYVKTCENFCYLFLITDQYSRKIVGYDVSLSLGIEGALRSLEMALSGVRPKLPLIHHSDRGIQYCSHDYVNLLVKNKVRISMTEENHVYENALAERVNGILKTELLGNTEDLPLIVVKRLIIEAIEIYNNERLHMNLGYRTPAAVHNSLN